MPAEFLWFAYGVGDFERFDTEAEARECAEKAFGECADEAPDGWSEEVDQICYGRIIGRVEKTCERPKLEGESHDGDETWDYALQRPEQDELARLREFRTTVELWLDGDRERDLGDLLAWWTRRERIAQQGGATHGG